MFCKHSISGELEEDWLTFTAVWVALTVTDCRNHRMLTNPYFDVMILDSHTRSSVESLADSCMAHHRSLWSLFLVSLDHHIWWQQGG